MYLRLDLPPTKEQIEKAQRFIEYTKVCALVDGIYTKREMDYLFMDLVTNKRAISHVSNEGKIKRVHPFSQEAEGLNKFAPVDKHHFRFLK